MFYPLIFILLLSSSSAFAGETVNLLPHSDSGQSSQGISNLRIVLSKLSETLKTNQDLEVLKKMGMPDREVERLKQALNLKVKQLTDDAIYVIHSI